MVKDKGFVALVKKSLGFSTGDCCGDSPTAPAVGDPDGGKAPCCGEPGAPEKESAKPGNEKPGGKKPEDSSDCC